MLVASTPALLQPGKADLWDSDEVVSDQSLHVRYGGKLLSARQSYWWRVQVRDRDGRASLWSPIARWEMGLLDPSDWSEAQWIQLAVDTRHTPWSKRPVQAAHMPKSQDWQAWAAPLFRREFAVTKKIRRARAYLSGLGCHELFVNGRRVGDAVLDPAITTYDVRAFYVTHDLTPFLRQGRNAVGLQVGNCFFGQNLAFAVPWLAWGPPTVLAKVAIDYADGASTVLVTNKEWRAETGPILFDNIYAGETYDARREHSGWSVPGYDDAPWQPAAEMKSPTAHLQAQMIPPIRRIRALPVQRVIKAGNGRWILDFGQNLAGWVRLRVQEKPGTAVRLRLAEVLSPDGKHLDTATTGIGATGVEQQQIYITKGRKSETWEPRFAYHGFRFAEVTGVSKPPQPQDFTAVQVRTAVEPRGTFRSADALLNRIYRTSLWTIEDNLHGTAEDCPHREKCGWLGDAQAMAETAIYNFDMAQFWTKFVDDIATVLGRGELTYWGQKATPGIACSIAVGRRLCGEAQPDWGAAYVLLPWYLYVYYGDTDVFTRHYEHLQRWIAYVGGLTEDHIVVHGFGDWYPPGGNTNMECPVPFTSTAYYYGTLRIMEHIASLLRKINDQAAFAREADIVKAALLKKFFDPLTHSYGSQTANAVALRFGLFPDGQDKEVARALARAVTEQHQGHAFVGIHGGRPLYSTLSSYGFDDVVFNMLRQTDWPSFAFLFAHGFTTWPEIVHKFERGKPFGADSLNHPMHSGFAVWFHDSVGGIRPASPGFKQIELTPHGMRQLAWAETDFDSLYGPIRSHWRTHGDLFTWNIAVPVNTTATVKIPTRDADTVTEGNQPARRARGVQFLRFEDDRAVYAVGSGTYRFHSRLPHAVPH